MDEFLPLTKRIIKGGSVILLFSVLLAPVGYFIRVLYSQTLTIDSYGLFYAALGLFTLITTYNALGFGYSVTYFLPKYIKKKNYSTCWNIYVYCQIIEVITAILISLLLIALAPWLAENYFKVQGINNLIYIFCLFLIVDSFLNGVIRLFMGLQQEKYYSSIHLISLSLILLFSLLFFFSNKISVTTYALAWTGAYLLSAVIYNFILYRNFGYLTKNKIRWDKPLFKKMFAFAVPALATTTISSLIIYSDIFFLTLFRGVKDVGIYNIILPIVSISTIFLYPLGNFIFPLVSHLMEKERRQIEYLLGVLLKIIPFAGMYFGLFIAMFPSAPVALLFGQKWVGLVENPMIILSFGYIAFLLFYYLAIIVSGMGKVNERLKISIWIALINIILSAFFVFKYGVVGAVIANIIIYFISIYLFGRIIKTVINFNYPYALYLKMIIFSAALYFIVKATNINLTSWVEFISAGIIYSSVFLTFGYYLDIFNANVLKLVLRINKTGK